jgi:hypothetical protein
MGIPNATMVRANLSTAVSTLYRKMAEDQLDQNTLFHMWGSSRPIEKGRSTVQLHRFDLGAENMDPLNEGEVGAGTNFGDTTFSMTPSHYGDFVIISDEVDLETYSDYRAATAQALGSRAALTIDGIHKSVFDAASGSFDATPVTTYLSRAVIGQVTTLLTDAKVSGGEPDGLFGIVVSPLAAYDLLFDPNAGEIMDLSRSLGAEENRRGATRMVVAETAGGRIYTSTLVTAPAATSRRCYFFGKNGYAYTHFAGRAPQFGKNQLRNFNLITHSSPNGSMQDPMGRLAMSMAYRFSLGVAFLDTTVYRLKTATVTVSLGA